MTLASDLSDSICVDIKNHKMLLDYIHLIWILGYNYLATKSFQEAPIKNIEEATNIPDTPPEKLVKEFPAVYKFTFLFVNIIFCKYQTYLHNKYKKNKNILRTPFYWMFLYLINPVIFMIMHLFFYTVFYPKKPLFHPKFNIV